jgi:uncharacterized membrane protein
MTTPPNWDPHPQVRSGSDLTFGERAADMVRNGMGSWVFVISFFAFMAVWAGLNVVSFIGHWDGYPFTFLNLVLSMLASVQGAILLIAAKRSDQISAELANANYESSIEDQATGAESLRLVQKLCKALGVDVAVDEES